ncbi:unnamed protein product [Rotaria sp. Silwood1]|nr:unnamed protein product [Rotaria sp. Silwood1]
MPSHDIPRLDNMTRLGNFLNIQHTLKTGTTIDFDNEWKLYCPNNDKKFQQTDISSCGVHVLIQTLAYIQKKKFVVINNSNVQYYRYQLAENLLRKAEPRFDDSDDLPIRIKSYEDLESTEAPPSNPLVASSTFTTIWKAPEGTVKSSFFPVGLWEWLSSGFRIVVSVLTSGGFFGGCWKKYFYGRNWPQYLI